ncbi:MAG: hypothetical protein M3015_11585 [Bacteroidota bacterium]|nr:hypothetical protein [Bacteroidota bacterium]
MMDITTAKLDELLAYTLRIELLDGKVLIYRIDAENKAYLMNKLGAHSEGDETNRSFPFLYFETSLKRQVIINNNQIIRITICFDFLEQLENANAWYDNFGVVEKDTSLVAKKSDDGETRLYVLEDEYLPQAIVYHKGKHPEDNFDKNPLLYDSLSEGCLGLFMLELDAEIPLRQFINFIDNDGEETFISLEQIILMEFESKLLYESNPDEISEEDDFNESNFFE